MKIYRFKDCFINLTERRVFKNRKYLELTPKTFDVLQLLVENCGEIVTKNEILGKVWKDSFVEEGNLAVHISKLRRLLDESKNEHLIETVQGSGYRFVSSVNSVSKREWLKHLPVESHSVVNEHSVGGDAYSVAVLPLKNETSDNEIDYLAEGLTDSFINSLTSIKNLKVIARNTMFRYKNKDVDVQEVGETLGVKAILTGRIKIIKDTLIISAELINVADNTQLWGMVFNNSFSEIIKIQEEIISAVSKKLLSEIWENVTSQSKPITYNSESYRYYLKGKYLLDKRTEADIHKAIKFFEKSVSFDSNNIHSYIEIIESYIVLYFSDYISHTDVRVKIQPLTAVVSKMNQDIDVVQSMLSAKAMYFDWDFQEAKRHVKFALTLNPNCLVARYRYSQILFLMGQFPQALKELQEIILIDPLSLSAFKRIGRLLFKMGQYEEAINYLQDALELEPKDYVTLDFLGAVLTELGNYDEALDIFQKSQSIQYNLETLGMIGCVYARSGKNEQVHQIIKQIEAQSKNNNRHSIKLARIYLDLGDKELAFNYLEQAFEQHEVDLIALKYDLRFKEIQNEPRFRELISRVGLPTS